MTKEERELAQRHIDSIFNGTKYIDLTDTSLSPYNITDVLYDNGFIGTTFYHERLDYWWEYHHPNVGTVTVSFNAGAFELILGVENDD